MRKNVVMMKLVVVAIVFALMVMTVQAQDGPVSYGGVEFPLGNVSFADGVVGFNPGSGTGESDGSAAVGPSDGGKGTGPSVIGDKGDVTLGSGGSITLKFTDNYLIDVEGLDLYVFEYGPSVEAFKVEISKDGSDWIDLGTVRGQPTGLDIHGKVASGDRFSYVRITDANPYAPRDPKIIGTEAYAGADIDAVGAIGAEERPDSDGDGVPNDIDECPGTPAGVAVDDKGCPIEMQLSVSTDKKTYSPDETVIIRGSVWDAKGGLDGATVVIDVDGTKLTATTDSSGKYSCQFSIPSDVSQVEYIVTSTASYSGYPDVTESASFTVGTAAEVPTPTPTLTPDGEQQRLYPVADGDVYAYSYRNWNWANWGQSQVMGAGWNPTGGEKRAYLKFDVPADLGVNRAVLKLYQYYNFGPVHTLGVYRVTGPWDEGTDTYHSGEVEETAASGELCWMQQPSFDPVSVATFTSATAVPAWVEVDITSLVQLWQAGTPNYGLVIKTTSDFEASSGFYTKEHLDQANRPVLELSLSGTAPIKGALKISDLRGTLNTDNDCNLYVADWGDNQVKMINPNGSTTTYASGIDRPRYQVFDSAGNLYVGSFDGNIYNVSASGGKTTVASGIWSPTGMGFDGAGNLYVAGSYDGKIHRIAPDGSKTTMDSGFAHPKHLAVYSNGNIYVVDSNGTLIVRITPEGGKASLVDLGETILGMATDGEYLYISHSDEISRIDTSGQVTQIATDLDQPSSLTVCNGSVFVTVKDGIVKLKISDETKTGTCDWTGAWETDWGRMELQQNGNKVNGTYTHDQGRIQGTVSGRNLTGTWSEYPSYSPPGDAGDIVFIISEDYSSFDGTWRYGTSGGWSGNWTGARKSTVSGTSYPEATLTHSGFDFSEGTTGESPIRDGEVIYWQPGHAGTHPDYPDYSEYLWWRNTHLDDVNHASQTKDMGAVDIATVRAVPAEWDKSPLIPPLLVGHTIVAKCYDGYVKFQVISVDTVDESARVKYWYSPDTTFDEGTPTLQPTP